MESEKRGLDLLPPKDEVKSSVKLAKNKHLIVGRQYFLRCLNRAHGEMFCRHCRKNLASGELPILSKLTGGYYARTHYYCKDCALALHFIEESDLI
ncbi:MAG: hypothetical protein ACYCQJ_15280 [Nitrososphaerales archaeon]